MTNDEPETEFPPASGNPTLDHRQVIQILDVALRIGANLLASNAGTADVEATIVTITSAYGLRDTQIDVTAATIHISVPRGVPGAPVTAMWRVAERQVDYSHLYRIVELARRIADEVPDPATATRRIVEIEELPLRYPPWLATLALGVMASALSVLFGARPAVVIIAGVVTILIDRFQHLLTRAQVPKLFQSIAAGAIATAVVVALTAADWLPAGSRPSLIVASNIVAQLSGMALVGTVQDGITGYHLTATGRFLEILISSVGLFVGVAAALTVGSSLEVEVVVSTNVSVPSWLSTPTRTVAGMIAAAAAAVTGHAQPRAVVVAGGAGVLSTVLYLSLLHLHDGDILASFVAATVVGFVGSLLATRMRVPFLVIAMSSIIPLVPGFSLYRGFVGLIEGNSATGLQFIVSAVAIALALAAGVVIGPLLAPRVRRDVRRVRDLVGTSNGNGGDLPWLRVPPLTGVTLRRRHLEPLRSKRLRPRRRRRRSRRLPDSEP